MAPNRIFPKEPGVYMFKNSEGHIIYIGKAKSLKERLAQYFNNDPKAAKTALMLKNAADVEIMIVDSEVEALLLENRLIKQHQPKYNISLKDSKTYAYIKITEDAYPRIETARKVGRKGEFFGPYTDGSARKESMLLAIKAFKIRTCKTMPKRACISYHIGICTAPCIGNVTKEQYNQQVSLTKKFLKGDTKEILDVLRDEMKKSSDELKFETAKQKRDQIESVLRLEDRQKVDRQREYDQDVITLIQDSNKALISIIKISKGVITGKKEIKLELEEELFENFIKLHYSIEKPPREIIVNQQFWKDDDSRRALEEYLAQISARLVSLNRPTRGEKLRLVEMAQKNAAHSLGENQALVEIQQQLRLKKIPKIIECFDISNLGHEHLVAAMTRWVDGKPDKKGYRRYKIKTVEGKNDDFASVREVVFRRYNRLATENETMPDLIIIDGGALQLSSAFSSLKELGLDIAVIGLAKKNEEIYMTNRTDPLIFKKTGKMMLLIRAIRDSCHKFAVGYNRKRREMKFREQQ